MPRIVIPGGGVYLLTAHTPGGSEVRCDVLFRSLDWAELLVLTNRSLVLAARRGVTYEVYRADTTAIAVDSLLVDGTPHGRN